MTTNYIVITDKLTVKQAMSSLIEQAAKNDNISTIFVVTEQQKFYGAINLKELIIARRDDLLENLVVTSYPYVYAEENIDECIEELKDYSEDSIPVLDNDNQLLGVITSASIIDLVDDEMGDDYAKLAGLTAEEDLKEPLKESMKKRLPWLIILLGLGMVVSSVVGIFEKVVTALPIIMCFQSLILDMAGNVGTQSLAVTIRVLMDESLTGKQKLELVWKEMRIGLCNGGLLGILSFALIGLYIYLFKGKTLLFSYAVSGCIGVALLLAMLISSAVGTCIPLFFKKINIDPAVASGPLITLAAVFLPRAVNAGCGQDAVVVLLQVPGHRFTAGPGHAHGVEEQNGRALPVAPCRKLHGISPRWLAYANFKPIIVPMLPAVKGLSSAILPGRPRAKARSPAAAGGQNNCCCPARRPGRSP